MNDENRILGLFFSDKDNLIYDKVKFSKDFSEQNKDQLNMLSYKFLGPVFLTAASAYRDTWIIEFIESTLSHRQNKMAGMDTLQSFFSLNSSFQGEDGMTNLFTLIGSNYTEDVKDIFGILSNYIHPSIIQGKIVNEDLLGNRFNFNRFINEELLRGIHIIDYSLGNARKIYWEEQHKYSCVGIIERIKTQDEKISNLYTFDQKSVLRKKTLNFIPSYYVISILPDYYEDLINETLKLFDKKSVYSNIRLINLSAKNKKCVYLEEFIVNNDLKRGYGAILVQDDDSLGDLNNLTHYKKALRQMLDENKELNELTSLFNSNIESKKWPTKLEQDLNNIRGILDNIYI
ncbi:MAG: hypothetical protein EU542_05935 [Promethearchaeota archaeon]|nr:MAG: hypothetical protein EU542_05935 [Candidatus Lokiarchaeota archaeon]